MHATTQQLLELRDGVPVDATVLNHVDLCATCSHELKLVTENQRALRALPQLSPSPQIFDQLSARLANERPARRSFAIHKHPLQWAVAAAVVAAIALWMVPHQVEAPRSQVAQERPVPAVIDESQQLAVAANDAVRRNELLDRSAALEAVAAQLATFAITEPAASTEEALTALEAQLALVDYNLRAAQMDQYIPAELNALLTRRVNTLEDIVGVQRAELARQGYHGFQVVTASNIEEDQTW